MSYAERHVVTITADASGDAIAYTPVVTGRIMTIRYVKSNYDNGVDFVITLEATGEAVLSVTNVTASTTYTPRVGTMTTAGAAALYASGGTAVNDYIVAANDRVKIVIDEAGNATTGTFHVVIG